MLLNFSAAAIITISAATLPTTPVEFSARPLGLYASERAAIETVVPAQLAALPPPGFSTLTRPATSELGVFGSVAISAARIPAARKWQDVQKTDYSAYFGDNCSIQGFEGCDSRFVTKIRDARNKAASLGERDMLDLINRTVNATMTYKPDSNVWGVGDYWATPAEMARKGAGDCEDYAIAKYWLLRGLGVPDQNLQLVLLQDTRRQLFHAVLVAHMPSGSYVLDNVTNRLQLDTAYAQYQPIMSFADGRSYIHGFAGGNRTATAMPTDLSAVAPGLGM